MQRAIQKERGAERYSKREREREERERCRRTETERQTLRRGQPV